MKIDNSGKVAAAYGAPVRAAKKDDAAAKAGATETATVAESTTVSATRFQSVGRAVQSADAFDADKVASIKAAIAAGQFKINPDAIADSLISSTRELLGR